MVLHPAAHLEIARQRHQDLLAEAERQRIAKAADHTPVTAARRWRSGRWWLQGRACSSPSGFGAARSDADAGLEV